MIANIPKAAIAAELLADYAELAEGIPQASPAAFTIDTAHARYAAVVEKVWKLRRASDAAGVTELAIVTAGQSRADPIAGNDDVGRRLEICQPCEHCAGVSIRRLYVLCAKKRPRCSCPNGEVPLSCGSCPIDKWSAHKKIGG